MIMNKEKDPIQIEIDIVEKTLKKQRKHYLNPTAKAFVNKFKKILNKR